MNIHSVLFASFFGRLLFSKRRSPGFSLCTWPYACVSVTLNRCIVYQSVADLGQEPGGPGSPYFEPTLRPKGRKKNFWDPPPPLPEGLNTPPWSMGAAVVKALASHQCGRGSNPGVDAICGLSLLLVLSLAPRGFFPGTPVFLLSSKTNTSKFQFDLERTDTFKRVHMNS